jgi:hypothetical protein
VEVTARAHAASRRARLGTGLAFVAVAMLAASVLAGLGFASSTPSAAQYQYGKTTAICHHTASKTHPWVTLHIDIRAWPAFLQHGDTLGACSGSGTPKTPGSKPGKTIAICHYAKSRTPPWVTLYINIHAWPGHLQHGDHLGPCGDNLPPTPRGQGKSKGHQHSPPMPTHDHGSKGGHGGGR